MVATPRLPAALLSKDRSWRLTDFLLDYGVIAEGEGQGACGRLQGFPDMSNVRASAALAIAVGFALLGREEPRYAVQNSRADLQTNLLPPLADSGSPAFPTKNAGRSKRRCNDYFSAQVLCSRAAERTDKAEKNLLACLKQEGFAVEPGECRPDPQRAEDKSRRNRAAGRDRRTASSPPAWVFTFSTEVVGPLLLDLVVCGYAGARLQRPLSSDFPVPILR